MSVPFRGIDETGDLLLAFGESGRLSASADGRNWNAMAMGSPPLQAGILEKVVLHGAAFDGESYVTVGSNGWNFRSANGTPPWTNHALAGDEDLHAVRFGHHRFIAIGAGGSLQTSADGAVWTPGALPPEVAGLNLSGLAFNAGVFIASGQNGVILRSTDGLTWSLAREGNSAEGDLQGVRYLNGRFYAFGDTGRILHSDTGIEWAELAAVAPDVSIVDLAVANDAYWAIAEEAVFHSSDGAEWIRRNAGPAGPPALKLGPAGCVMDHDTLYIAGHSGQIIALTFAEEPAVRILREPEDLMATEGETIQFSVAAEGAVLDYLWHFDGVALEDSPVVEGSRRQILRLREVTGENAGLYFVTVSGLESRAASLTVKPYNERQSYEAFVVRQFPEEDREIPAITGPEADADGDGTTNLLEFALGTDPRSAGPVPLQFDQEEHRGHRSLKLTYRRLTNPVGLTYLIEESLDLRSWRNPLAPFEQETEALPDAAVEQVTVRQPIADVGDATRYLRLRVIQEE